jgi:hypothetical protein
MADIFVNPHLPNYFMSAAEVTSAATARSLVDEYEAAKVILLPNLKERIDVDFWARFDSDPYPELKKFGPTLDPSNDTGEQRRQLKKALISRGLEKAAADVLIEQFQRLIADLLPIYSAIFAGYAFERWKVMLRLNTIMAENMHVDTYKKENELHFARMFINLDTQPRIWHTSWRIQDMIERALGRIPPHTIEGLTRGEVWSRINKSFFGQNSREWWDDQPRHVAFFEPGDVWIVDSRQVAHQIFYGRRALSIDFAVPKDQMKDPTRHYLNIAERFRSANAAAFDGTAASA